VVNLTLLKEYLTSIRRLLWLNLKLTKQEWNKTI